MKGRRRNDLPRDKRLVVTYVVLRLIVLFTLVAQAMNHNYENVFYCILALILFMLPSIIERRMLIDIPDTLEIIILVFIFAAEILGEIRAYYQKIPAWDTALHTVTGVGALQPHSDLPCVRIPLLFDVHRGDVGVFGILHGLVFRHRYAEGYYNTYNKYRAA